MFNSEWVIPCNPKFFNIHGAFNKFDALDWRQSTNIQVGDTVYLYIGVIDQAIMYKCQAVAVDLFGTGEIDDSEFDLSGEGEVQGRYMRLRLVEKYPKDRYPLAELKKNGLRSVQGPSRVTPELRDYLQKK